MAPMIPAQTAAAAYATASQGMVFTNVALSFAGLGWALALMLRPKTNWLCLWSMALFSLAWLIESTTHLLGVGGHAGTDSLKYGVWAAVGLFGIGMVVGVLGVLAYLRNEHRYERGLFVGVVASLANLWVVGGIATALRNNQTAALGRGLVIPVMTSGGPVDPQAIAENLAKIPGRQGSDEAMKMAAMLGRAASDLAMALSGGKGSAWEMKLGNGGEGPAAALAGHPAGSPEVLRALHPEAQHLLTLSSEPGWMSLGLTKAPEGADAAATVAAGNEKALAEQALTLTPLRRLRAVRTNLAGFEVIRISTQASVKGLAGAVFFDQWVAVAGGHALSVLACSPEQTPTFLGATDEMVIGVLRTLQRGGVSGAVPTEVAQSQRVQATKYEREDRYPEALTLWQKVAATTPNDGESFLGVVRCLWKLGKTKEALAWLETGVVPTPGTVSTAVGALRIRAATAQPNARETLVERFEAGLADDEALASLMLSFVTRDDRVGAAEVLSKYGPRHAATVVSKWQAYLSAPTAAPTAGSTASAPAAAPPKGSAVVSGKPATRPGRASTTRTPTTTRTKRR